MYHIPSFGEYYEYWPQNRNSSLNGLKVVHDIALRFIFPITRRKIAAGSNTVPIIVVHVVGSFSGQILSPLNLIT